MARVHDAAHDASGVHWAVFHAFAAPELRVPVFEDDRAASAAVAAVRRDAFVVRPCKDGFSRHRAGPHRPAGARESAGARRADPSCAGKEVWLCAVAYRDGAAAGCAAARRVPGRVYPVGLYLYAVLRR